MRESGCAKKYARRRAGRTSRRASREDRSPALAGGSEEDNENRMFLSVPVEKNVH